MNHPSAPEKSLSCPTRGRQSSSLIECNGCQNTWTGTSACHCSGCHRTFTGLAAFDIHRSGSRCKDPMSIFTKDGMPRLVPVQKLYWFGWRLPGENPMGRLV